MLAILNSRSTTSIEKTKLVTVHANFLNGGNNEKFFRLYSSGLWYATPGSKENDDFYHFFGMEKTTPPQPTDMYVTHDRHYWDGTCQTFEPPIFGAPGTGTNGTGIILPDGLLVSLWHSSDHAVYILENNTKRDIPDLTTFISMGRDFSETLLMDAKDWDAIPVGPPIKSVSN